MRATIGEIMESISPQSLRLDKGCWQAQQHIPDVLPATRLDMKERVDGWDIPFFPASRLPPWWPAHVEIPQAGAQGPKPPNLRINFQQFPGHKIDLEPAM